MGLEIVIAVDTRPCRLAQSSFYQHKDLSTQFCLHLCVKWLVHFVDQLVETWWTIDLLVSRQIHLSLMSYTSVFLVKMVKQISIDYLLKVNAQVKTAASFEELYQFSPRVYQSQGANLLHLILKRPTKLTIAQQYF